ncbi:Solute carrier family 2, facilitated glucose transporter member 2 [Toxocara canis]|uniref:Solute carrier family 2, facilitated glucose transporter member 2 n=1 Tax=Toxocara canis TaxID=6265 RepID=A0A0B2VUU0_TOXCA|nr:Solute carrier family 2, facilitated glucose transporter member 2 [Toxocara canis]
MAEILDELNVDGFPLGVSRTGVIKPAKQRPIKARNALAFYHGDSNSAALDAELRVCEESLLKKKGTSDGHSKGNIQCIHEGLTIMFNVFKASDPVSKVIRHGAWVGVMVKIAYVFTGARCLRAYSTFMLHDMAHWSLSSALYGSFAIGVLRLPLTFVPVILVDRIGRRPLIIISMIASLISQIVIMVCVEMGEQWKMGTLLGLSCLLLVNACGLGSVSRFYSAELVPRHLLLNSVALLTILEALMKIAVEFSFYPVANIVGGLSMLLFACPTAVLIVLVWYLCPETSGKHVNEVGGLSMLLFACPTAVLIVLVWYLCPETSGKHVNEVLNSIANSKHVKVTFNA